MADVKRQLLGGLAVPAFLRRHWQKQPLLIRDAIPGFAGVIDVGGMIELACREDGESRLVMHDTGRWTVEHGPFERKRFSRLPKRNWTLLVQGLEQVLPAARQLVSNFDFIPYSRLDDVMISYAPPGGGVGAHFDSYDVFLLQGPGQRCWRVGRQHDLSLVDNAPLKILKHFLPDGQCLLSAGDMLYLPPQFAHEGIAVDACYTYSIGFRVPSNRELMSQFLIFLDERLADDGRRYGDPELSAQLHPARIDPGMVGKVERILGEIDWNRHDVAEFLGSYLTEPKPHVRFAPTRKPLPQAAFAKAARRGGVELALATLMLYGDTAVFINGEPHQMPQAAATPLRRLANARRLGGGQIPSADLVIDLLYRWYRAGYIYLSRPDPAG